MMLRRWEDHIHTSRHITDSWHEQYTRSAPVILLMLCQSSAIKDLLIISLIKSWWFRSQKTTLSLFVCFCLNIIYGSHSEASLITDVWFRQRIKHNILSNTASSELRLLRSVCRSFRELRRTRRAHLLKSLEILYIFKSHKNKTSSTSVQWFQTWGAPEITGGAHNVVCSEAVRLPKLYLCTLMRLIDAHASKSCDQFKMDVAVRRSLRESQFQLMCWCGLQTIYQFLNCVDWPSKTGLMINNVHRAFREHCRAFGAGRSEKKKAPQQPITKWRGKAPDLVAEEQAEVVGGTTAKEWQRQWRR